MTFNLDGYRVILLGFTIACFFLLLYRHFNRNEVALATGVPQPEKLTDRLVLLVIASGLIAILLSVIWGLFMLAADPTAKEMPNWAENVLVSISTAAALKLGDCLSALIALAGGRQVQRLGEKLGDSQPAGTASDGSPTGTIDDPLHVAGAVDGETPVTTQPEGAEK